MPKLGCISACNKRAPLGREKVLCSSWLTLESTSSRFTHLAQRCLSEQLRYSLHGSAIADKWHC